MPCPWTSASGSTPSARPEVPDLGLVRLPPGVRVLEIDPVLSRTVELVHRTASAEPPAIVAARETLVGIADDLGLARAAGAV